MEEKYHRLTLRLPIRLFKRLEDHVKKTGKTTNVTEEINLRLEDSFADDCNDLLTISYSLASIANKIRARSVDNINTNVEIEELINTFQSLTKNQKKMVNMIIDAIKQDK
jgi:hypothetical protein